MWLMIFFSNFKGIVLSLFVNKYLIKVRFNFFVEILYNVGNASLNIFHILKLLSFSKLQRFYIICCRKKVTLSRLRLEHIY